MQNAEVTKRSANAAHVTATNNLEGVRISEFLSVQLSEYTHGRVSSDQMLAAVKAKYIKK